MAPKPKKPSTKYSPAPMSDAAKRKASRAGAEKARQYTDLPARRPSPNPARTSYSPQMMTEFDKRKAAARGKATAAKTKPKSKSTAAKVAGLAGKVAGSLAKNKRVGKAVGSTKTQAVPRKAMKRPTGELPKRSSNLAKFIAGTKSNNLSPAQARVAAGKFEDTKKATPGFNRKMGYLDRSGVALGKAVKQTQKMTKQKKK